MTCDHCGIELHTEQAHLPHDRGCPNVDGTGLCVCDNCCCLADCWQCDPDHATWEHIHGVGKVPC